MHDPPCGKRRRATSNSRLLAASPTGKAGKAPLCGKRRLFLLFLLHGLLGETKRVLYRCLFLDPYLKA